MGIKYYSAEDVKEEALDIVKTMNWDHVDFNHLGFLRSRGSTTRGTIARCHALGKAMQLAMGRPKGFYLIEVISEKFDRLPKIEQTKTIIHELMHIPKTFGGGFIHHDKVHERSVRVAFDQYQNLKRKNVFSMLNTPVEKNNEETIRLVEEKIISAPAPLRPSLVIKESMKKMEKKFRWF